MADLRVTSVLSRVQTALRSSSEGRDGIVFTRAGANGGAILASSTYVFGAVILISPQRAMKRLLRKFECTIDTLLAE